MVLKKTWIFIFNVIQVFDKIDFVIFHFFVQFKNELPYVHQMFMIASSLLILDPGLGATK